ncbi:hypothetical protein CGRA01v4_12660 [Colletotrichum graminicola]|nr:hypothetical protein CGRA01v4_12660 [Colletotrichum graminicola]
MCGSFSNPHTSKASSRRLFVAIVSRRHVQSDIQHILLIITNNKSPSLSSSRQSLIRKTIKPI